MPDTPLLFTITPLPLVSVLVWILLAVAALYLARRPFHGAVIALGRLFYNALRLAATSVKISQRRLDARNRDVLLTDGIKRSERQTRRDRERTCKMVARCRFGSPPGLADEGPEAMRPGEGVADRRPFSSSTTQFFTSGLVLGVFAVGAVINYCLIAPPMADMVGGHSYFAGVRTSEVASVFIVGLQIVLGLFLMDALGVTRLFSVWDGVGGKQRAGLLCGILAMLILLAGMEALLAFMRDRISADVLALEQSLAGMEPSSTAASGVRTAGQMILGFMLPFILAMAAIPIQGFIRSSRTLLGMVVGWALGVLTVFLRMIGSLGYHGGRLAVRLYDLVIFPAIWLESLVLGRSAATCASGGSTAAWNRLMPSPPPLTMAEETVTCEKTAD